MNGNGITEPQKNPEAMFVEYPQAVYKKPGNSELFEDVPPIETSSLSPGTGPLPHNPGTVTSFSSMPIHGKGVDSGKFDKIPGKAQPNKLD